MSDFAFAGYPAPFIYGDDRKSKLQQLIWGDYVRITGEPQDGWVPVYSRRTPGWMREGELQEERLLEICFVDIGQGDGALLVLPDDEFMLVDAGESDNMLRFLSWRFNLRRNPERVIRFRNAVISHPDKDHYKGFADLFKSKQFEFGTVFHNGIVERKGPESQALGPTETVDGTRYLTEFVRDHATLEGLVGDAAIVGGKAYPRMLMAGIDNGAVQTTQGIRAKDGFLPGFEEDKPVRIEVLGPCTTEVGGVEMLKTFGDPGKTKNGHSVVLKLTYGQVRVMLGGDLNIPAELHLLREHVGVAPADEEALEEYVEAARKVFQVDVAKACHHGSADFTSLYLRAVNPIATVISSGDDEPHAHPRPDALGAFGKFSRGERPLIFSTELARSARENIKSPDKLRQELNALMERRDDHEPGSPRRATIDQQIDKLLATIERSVAVYGMINLRTDGKSVLLAQKLEVKRGTGEEWDVHRLEQDGEGEFVYVAKHKD